MRILITSILTILISSCVQQPDNSKASLNPVSVQTGERGGKLKEDPRVAFLKDQAILAGNRLDKFYEVKSLFGIMKALQDGEITTTDLEGSLFYFKDAVGEDTGYYYDSTYFKCVQVIEMGEVENDSGGKVPIYQALYTNSQIDMTVTVLWAQARPLQGQKLNVDFLVYGEVGTYKNRKDEDRTEVIFMRPAWAVANGYTY